MGPPLHKLLPMRQRWLVGRFACFERGEALVDFVPIDYVPPRGEIFGAAVVVLQVVGVLPDVVAEDGVEALGERVVLVGGGNDLNAAVGFASEPNPSGAELFCTGVIEFRLEVVEVSERFLDCFGHGASGIASALGLHDLPEHGVVDMASAIVADGGADVFGNRIEVANQIFGGFAGELGMLFNRGVQVFHVSAVVHVVMQSHGLLVDRGVQCVIGIRQWG
jgi:hypothetical protein